MTFQWISVTMPRRHLNNSRGEHWLICGRIILFSRTSSFISRTARPSLTLKTALFPVHRLKQASSAPRTLASLHLYFARASLCFVEQLPGKTIGSASAHLHSLVGSISTRLT